MSDVDGDGIWAEQVWLDCGECEACALAAAVDAVEADL